MCCAAKWTCAESHWKCANNVECVPKSSLCNHWKNCMDGSDEYQAGCGRPPSRHCVITGRTAWTVLMSTGLDAVGPQVVTV